MTEPAPEVNRPGRSRVKKDNLDAGLEQIRAALHGLKFGQVVAIVQDGVIVQIERIEKKRMI